MPLIVAFRLITTNPIAEPNGRQQNWAIENSDFPILTESEDRIMATSTLRGTSGVGVTVNRRAIAGRHQLVVDLECFSAYGCPDLWDLKLDFNQVVNGYQGLFTLLEWPS